MALLLRIFAVVPPLLRVPIFLREARAAGLGFKVAPIKSYCGGIEERAVEIPVLSVALGGSELVEVEDVRAEYEVVLYLLDFHVPSGGGLAEVYHGVGLAVFLDVGVHLPPEFGRPFVPIFGGHYFARVVFPRFRDFYFGFGERVLARERRNQRGCGQERKGGKRFHCGFRILIFFTGRNFKTAPPILRRGFAVRKTPPLCGGRRHAYFKW